MTSDRPSTGGPEQANLGDDQGSSWKDEDYLPGFREDDPTVGLCWRMLNDGRSVCIKDRGHDDGAHELSEAAKPTTADTVGLRTEPEPSAVVPVAVPDEAARPEVEIVREALGRADEAFCSLQMSAEPFDLAPFRRGLKDAQAALVRVEESRNKLLGEAITLENELEAVNADCVRVEAERDQARLGRKAWNEAHDKVNSMRAEAEQELTSARAVIEQLRGIANGLLACYDNLTEAESQDARNGVRIVAESAAYVALCAFDEFIGVEGVRAALAELADGQSEP